VLNPALLRGPALGLHCTHTNCSTPTKLHSLLEALALHGCLTRASSSSCLRSTAASFSRASSLALTPGPSVTTLPSHSKASRRCAKLSES
jgi:hypothetical protein